MISREITTTQYNLCRNKKNEKIQDMMRNYFLITPYYMGYSTAVFSVILRNLMPTGIAQSGN